MRLERAKNAKRNIFVGVFYKIYTILLPFIIRTVIIYSLGVEYIGLDSLFASILQVLNLTELGVGIAMVYSMYKPIADDDTDTICALLKLYKKYYRIIGAIIAIIGLLLIPLLPRLISGNVPDSLNLYVLYILKLSATVASYWLFSYKNSLLAAHQRSDVTNKVLIVTNTIQFILQAFLILFFKNYYYYMVAAIIGQIGTNIVTAIVVNKMYPLYKPKGELDVKIVKNINQRIRDLFTSKVGSVIQNSFDSIVISSFLGLAILGKYNNYYYIMISVFGIVTIIFNSITAGVGNSLIVESKTKNYNDFLKLSFITFGIISVCSACFFALYQPFMKIWVGEENLLSFGLVVCLVLYFACYTFNQMMCVYKDASGMWHSDRFRPLTTALVNLLFNLATVKTIGLFGVVLSTVLSMAFVGMPWLMTNLFKYVFKMDIKLYVKKIIAYILACIISSLLVIFICNFFPNGGVIILIPRLVIAILISSATFCFFFHRSNEFRQSIELLQRVIKKM